METMTNEEKAKTLVDGLGIIYTDCNRVTINKLLMKMADWKDEQHKQEKQRWIDKACEWIDNQSFCGMIEYPADELIEELKKTMKGE